MVGLRQISFVSAVAHALRAERSRYLPVCAIRGIEEHRITAFVW